MKQDFLDQLVTKILSLIEKEHQYLLAALVIFQARTYAVLNKPELSAASLEPFLDSIKGAYAGLKKKIAIRLAGGIQAKLGAVNVATANQLLEINRNAIKKEEKKVHDLQMDRDRLHCTENLDAYRKQQWLLWLLALGEIIWAIAVFLRFGDVTALAILLGLAIGIAQVVCVKMSVQVIKEIEDLRKRRFAIIAAFGLFFLFSLALGLLRYWFIHVGHGENIPLLILSPISFIIINFVFIVAVALTVFFYYPTREELQKLNKVKAYDKEVNKIRKILHSLETRRTQLVNNREALIELRTRIMHAEQTLAERVDSMYQEAVGTFKHENVNKREDGVFPTCFQGPHASLPAFDTETISIEN